MPRSFDHKVLLRPVSLVVFVCILTSVPLARAQITTNTALQVGESQGVVRLQAHLVRSTGDPGPMARELTAFAFPIVGAYGVNTRLTLFGVVPFASKALEVTTPTGRFTRRTTGLADARLFARYTVYRANRRGQMIRLAPLAGLKLPTGQADDTDVLGRLPRPLQLGSGSWDPFAGLVFTWQTLAWQLDLSPAYTRHTEADGFRFGDEARLDAAFKVRVWPRTVGGGVPGFLYLAAETNLRWQDRSKLVGEEDPNTGGTTWYLVPGIQFVSRRYVIEGGVQLPVVQDLGGMALENDFTAILSVRFNFDL